MGIITRLPLLQMLHMQLRHDYAPREPQAYAAAFNWVTDNRPRLEKVLVPAEWRLLICIHNYYDDHRVAPSRDAIEDIVRQESKPQAMLDILKEYDAQEADLKDVSAADMHVWLDMRRAEFDDYGVDKVLNRAKLIITSGEEIPDPRDKTKKIVRKGAKDAVNYVAIEMQKGILLDDIPAQGGLVSEIADTVRPAYDIDALQQQSNNLFIPTGLGLIDGSLGGLRRGELNGVLGYTGQRKTGAVRTFAFNAALEGFRVLHIPLETTVREELTAYLVMHSQAMRNFKPNDLSKKRVERALLSPRDYEFLFGPALSNFKEVIGENLIIRSPGSGRTWPDVKAIIERENYIEPLDLVVIDYLTLLGTPGSRDDKADKVSIAQDAKQLALHINNDRGMCILTPVQGSRKGYEEAESDDGSWHISGIFMYSELDKSLDNIFYTFMDDGLKAQNMLKFGSCKTRRDADLPPTLVNVCDNSGMFQDSSETSSSVNVSDDEAHERELAKRNVPVFSHIYRMEF